LRAARLPTACHRTIYSPRSYAAQLQHCTQLPAHHGFRTPTQPVCRSPPSLPPPPSPCHHTSTITHPSYHLPPPVLSGWSFMRAPALRPAPLPRCRCLFGATPTTHLHARTARRCLLHQTRFRRRPTTGRILHAYLPGAPCRARRCCHAHLPLRLLPFRWRHRLPLLFLLRLCCCSSTTRRIRRAAATPCLDTTRILLVHLRFAVPYFCQAFR